MTESTPSMATTVKTRVALVILTEISSLMYSGTVFGWAPMLLVLRREGLFAHVCASQGEEPWCGEQQELLGSIFTFAAVIYSASGILVGAFIDEFGPSSGILLAGICSVIGYSLFACSWSWAPMWTIVCGYSLIGVGGMAFFQCAFKAQYAFPEIDNGVLLYKYQTIIIAGATTLGDASVLIWLLFELISTHFEIPLATLFTYYGVFTLAMSASLFLLWRACEVDILLSDERYEQEEEETPADYGSTSTSLSPTTPQHLSVSQRPFAQQLLSKEFLFLFFFACIHTTRCNLYLGLLSYFYESKQFSFSSSSTADYYVNVTSALIPLGCLCAPLIDALIRTLGFGLTAQTIAFLAAAQSLIMLSPSAPLQLLAACLFVVYRANVFAFPPSFAGKIFGARTVGRLTGLMFTLMAPVQFTITPALGVTLNTFGDDFRPLNTVELLALLPLVAFTAWLMSASKEVDLQLPTGLADFEGLPSYSALPVTPPTSSRRHQQRSESLSRDGSSSRGGSSSRASVGGGAMKLQGGVFCTIAVSSDSVKP